MIYTYEKTHYVDERTLCPLFLGLSIWKCEKGHCQLKPVCISNVCTGLGINSDQVILRNKFLCFPVHTPQLGQHQWPARKVNRSVHSLYVMNGIIPLFLA
jgi:hypothetical protein